MRAGMDLADAKEFILGGGDSGEINGGGLWWAPLPSFPRRWRNCFHVEEILREPLHIFSP